MRAEEPVDPGEDGRVIAIAEPVIAVVPVVERRSGDEPLERSQAAAHVRVDEEAPQRAEDGDRRHHRVRCPGGGDAEPEQVHGHQSTRPDEHHVDGMGAGVHQPIQVLGAVMHRVEPPQQRAVVGPAVHPVGAGVVDDEGQQQLEPGREGRNGAVEAEGIAAVERRGEHRQRERDDRRGQQRIDEVPTQVDACLGPPYVRRPDREQLLQGHEHGHEDHEPDHEPQRVEEKRFHRSPPRPVPPVARTGPRPDLASPRPAPAAGPVVPWSVSRRSSVAAGLRSRPGIRPPRPGPTPLPRDRSPGWPTEGRRWAGG